MEKKDREVGNVVNSGNAWDDFVKPFASVIGKDVDEVTEAFKCLVGEPGPDAIALLQNEEDTPFNEIKGLLKGVPIAKLRKAVRELIRKKPEAEPVGVSVVATPSFDILPSVPDDESFLAALKTGGELKVTQTIVISALRAALANRSGLYEIPAMLVERMEHYAEELEEAVPKIFFELRKTLTRRTYADIFAALPVEGQFITQGRKNKLLGKLDNYLWTALSTFQEQLVGWMDSWQKGMANPAAMMAAFAALASGGGGATLPPGMMQPPETDTLRDAAESVINDINTVFAGTGIPVAMALAYDAQNIKSVLENRDLPAQIGAGNREQMLKMLKVNVSADYVRLERNITRYALAIMEYPKITSGQEELAYLAALQMLGASIPWSRLSGGN